MNLVKALLLWKCWAYWAVSLLCRGLIVTLSLVQSLFLSVMMGKLSRVSLVYTLAKYWLKQLQYSSPYATGSFAEPWRSFLRVWSFLRVLPNPLFQPWVPRLRPATLLPPDAWSLMQDSALCTMVYRESRMQWMCKLCLSDHLLDNACQIHLNSSEITPFLIKCCW